MDMFETVKEKLDEVISISEKCPEKYQIKCFEILLDALVHGQAPSLATQATDTLVGTPELQKNASSFLSNNNISQDQLIRVFHINGGECNIIVQNLEDKTMSEKQVKLALLLGVKNLLQSGTPSIPKQELIGLCKDYASYDSSNFSAHMKNRKQLFVLKGRQIWELTQPGREKAAEVIKALAQ